jgi:hypothetical protein
VAERNRFTDAVIRVADRYKRQMKENDPQAIPFMLQKVRRRKALDEFERMSPQEREKLMGRMGIGEIREMLKRGRGDAERP